MSQIPLGIGAYSRPYGKLPEIRMENRFFEQNPVGAEKVSLLSRPGSKLFLEIGDGPIRTMYGQPGVFNGDLFIVSGETLYRYNEDDGPTEITGTVAGVGFPVMTSIAIPSWEAVFITDGETMQYYEGEGRSSGRLSLSSAIISGDGVVIGTTHYEWTSASVVDTGSPDGTGGNPWLVKLGANDAESLSNLYDAINLGGVAGTNYSTDTVANPDVRAFGLTETEFQVRALVAGVGSDTTATTSSGGTVAWDNATLTGGGGNVLKPVSVPDAVSIVDIATLASFVICVQADSQKFFWLRPGEVDIDPLDFSSAESLPDHIVNLVVVGDQFWLLGQSSTEVWYASGDGEQPFLRTQGRAFSQGVLPNTLARINETVVVVGQDGIVYKIAGVPERVSHHGIEEKIRLWRESL